MCHYYLWPQVSCSVNSKHTHMRVHGLYCILRCEAALCRIHSSDKGHGCTPAVFSPATNAVLAAVMTSPVCGKSAHHQQAFTATKGSPIYDVRPPGLSEQTTGFIKTVPMQHVQTHYLESKQNIAGSCVSCETVPVFTNDSPAKKATQVQPKMPLQPFAQLLRLSSDSNSSDE